MFNILETPFFKLKTEYQRIKYFESNNVFFKPKTIVLGFIKETKIVSGYGSGPKAFIFYKGEP